MNVASPVTWSFLCSSFNFSTVFVVNFICSVFSVFFVILVVSIDTIYFMEV
jgi:hypothetical protein